MADKKKKKGASRNGTAADEKKGTGRTAAAGKKDGGLATADKKGEKNAGAPTRADKYSLLVAPRLYLVQSLAAADVSEADIAERLGISRQTFCAYKKKYPALSRALSKGRADICDNIRSALYKRAMGYDYTEERTYTKDGVTTTEKVSKHCAADIRAAEILLRQYDPNYRDRGGSTDTGAESVKVIFEDMTEEAGI